ncbi:MAG TPA: hypothetical protein VG982_03275 [Candidatus Paceibacterota bacterium]|nr:hypothetical protein [Candidatus Paceibacterota bacterium]
MINDFIAKKLGEVLSFANVSTDTYERGRATLIAVIGAERVADIEEKNRIHGEELMRIATDAGVIDAVLTKATSDARELMKMRELYIANNWDAANEILEWSGFAEGAAIVHWGLIRGAAETLNNEALLTLCEEAINWHYELLEMAESELGSIGQDKATA